MTYRFTIPMTGESYRIRNMTPPDAIAEARNESSWRGTAVWAEQESPFTSTHYRFIAGPSGLVTSHEVQS